MQLHFMIIADYNLANHHFFHRISLLFNSALISNYCWYLLGSLFHYLIIQFYKQIWLIFLLNLIFLSLFHIFFHIFINFLILIHFLLVFLLELLYRFITRLFYFSNICFLPLEIKFIEKLRLICFYILRFHAYNFRSWVYTFIFTIIFLLILSLIILIIQLYIIHQIHQNYHHKTFIAVNYLFNYF